MTALLGVDDTLSVLVDCVHEALVEVERPVCIWSTTIGTPVIANGCECPDGSDGQLWGNLNRVYRAGRTSYDQAATVQRPCAPVDWAAEFTITLARCFPMIDETGELPSPEDQAEAARTFHADVATLQRAIHCCQDLEPPTLVSIDVETDPQGGMSYLTATVRAPISLAPSKNALP